MKNAVKHALDGWFDQRGWKAFKFQKDVWKAIAAGESGLLHATTGAGKTYAVWLGALMAYGAFPHTSSEYAATKNRATTGELKTPPPLTVLWITPMRALAADTLRALQQPLDFLRQPVIDADGVIQPLSPAASWTVGARSGDTAASERSAQNKRLPTVLVTTPESLSLLLARADAQEVLGKVRMVVVDEWHELLGNKRGVQVQLALARLRSWQANGVGTAHQPTQNPSGDSEPQPAVNATLPSPGKQEPQNRLCRAAGGAAPSGGSEPREAGSVGAITVWGMSATLGNLSEAMHTLLGHGNGALVRGAVPKKLVIDTLLPQSAERFPWGGHLGLTMLPQVVNEIEKSSVTLVFTNTRSQAEIWYQSLIAARPDWAGVVALHHGSLDRGVREWVEAGLKNGQLKAVVCTSSLDLGVDFLPVERVLQIGSPKGVSRLLQRAGRSGHAPGLPSRITLVPTQSIEMVEGVAARVAVASGLIEARTSPEQPLDVLVQHLVTVALGGGFKPDDLYAEVRSTAAYAQLSPESWEWALGFVRQGGTSLAAYPDYHRTVPDVEGIWRVPNLRLARRHRMNIGTIVSDSSIAVQYLGGGKIGTVEESFIARMRTGDCFLFGGRLLELVRVHEMTAWVRRTSGKRAAVPRWGGSRFPLSVTLAEAVVDQLALAAQERFDSPELKCVKPLLQLQQRWSALPTPATLLAETLETREGTHLFLYPFAGRHVHLGLANLIAWRVAQHQPNTFSIAVNDYGFELLSATAVDWPTLLPAVLAAGHDITAQEALAHADPLGALLHEVLASLNASELARRRFREIARVSGLIFQGYPGEKRSSKQLQASSSLFYEVFRKYDPTNRLLLQAEQELLAQELEIGRLGASLAKIAGQQLVVKALSRPTPFAFPLMVERYREQMSNENVADRIARMVEQLEQAAGGPAHKPHNAGSAGQVKSLLTFGQDNDSDRATAAAKRQRRERKPSRPLPPL